MSTKVAYPEGGRPSVALVLAILIAYPSTLLALSGVRASVSAVDCRGLRVDDDDDEEAGCSTPAMPMVVTVARAPVEARLLASRLSRWRWRIM